MVRTCLPFSIFRSQRGASAIGVAVGVGAGVAALGLGLSVMIQNSREAGNRTVAKELANQLNQSALTQTLTLIRSKALQQETVDGNLVWTNKSGTSAEWSLEPGTQPNSQRILIRTCDPRFMNMEQPGVLAACPSDQIESSVTFLPNADGATEVLATTSVRLFRRDPARTDDVNPRMETAATRAILSSNQVECGFAPTVSPSRVISGGSFQIQVAGFSPSDARVFLQETGATFLVDGPGTRHLVMAAPVLAPGAGPSTLTYNVRVESPDGVTVVGCTPVSVTVHPCTEYTSEEAVREIYRQVTINSDSDVAAATIAAEALQIARGTKSTHDVLNTLRSSPTAHAKANTGAYAAGLHPELLAADETLTNLMRAHYDRGGLTAEHVAEIGSHSQTKLGKTVRNKLSCLYSTHSSCSSYYTMPKAAAALAASGEFRNAPNNSTYHDDPIAELWMQILGIEVASMTSEQRTHYNQMVSDFRTGRHPWNSMIAALRARPEYHARGIHYGEMVNGMVRTLLSRQSTAGESNYYATLWDAHGASLDFVSKSLRSKAEFADLGGCPVPKPLPICKITSDRTELRPGQTADLRLAGYEELTAASWDGNAMSVSGSGLQLFTKSQAFTTAGTVLTTSATVTNSAGTASCSLNIRMKNSVATVQGTRGAHHCAGPYLNRTTYNWWQLFIPNPGDWYHAYYSSDGYRSWRSGDMDKWFPYMKTLRWIKCYNGLSREASPDYTYICDADINAPAPPPAVGPNRSGQYCQATPDRMPALYTNPADGATYQLMTNPHTGLPADLDHGGVCGSPEAPCYVTKQMSPLVVDLKEKGIEYQPGVPFDLGEGTMNYFWPKFFQSAHFVVLDKNGNGRIDNGTELFGNVTPDPEGKLTYPNGFDALAAHDSNKDGFINAKDPVYAKLRLWGDVNANGVSEPGELSSLRDKAVASIDLKYLEIQEHNDNFGNKSNQRSVVELANGEWRKVFDLWFVTSGNGVK